MSDDTKVIPITDRLRSLGAHTLGDNPSPEAQESFLRRWARSLVGDVDELRIRIERKELVQKYGFQAGIVDAAVGDHPSLLLWRHPVLRT